MHFMLSFSMVAFNAHVLTYLYINTECYSYTVKDLPCWLSERLNNLKSLLHLTTIHLFRIFLILKYMYNQYKVFVSLNAVPKWRPQWAPKPSVQV